ncbi:MAG: 50S ribosomal protein L25 [Planctomycetota bacterium]
MSETDTITVEKREKLGKLNSRRLRAEGIVPAVLYGHGEEPVSLKMDAKPLRASLRHGAKLVELTGAAKGSALLQDVQWDTFEQHILHVDLLRVDAKEKVVVEVPLLIRGQAPGESEGGVVDHLVHHIEIETTAGSIPEQLHVSVNDLHLGGSLLPKDIEDMPAGAKAVAGEDLVLVSCHEPKVVVEEEADGVEGSAEPEVIGGKKDDEEATGG